jgi:hypothetical protein
MKMICLQQIHTHGNKVINRKSAPSVKFLNNLFKIKNIYAPSLDYGKRHESVAKGKYLEKNRENHFHECGFVVNKSCHIVYIQ